MDTKRAPLSNTNAVAANRGIATGRGAPKIVPYVPLRRPGSNLPNLATPPPVLSEIPEELLGDCISEGEKIWRAHVIHAIEEKQRKKEAHLLRSSLQTPEQNTVDCSYSSTSTTSLSPEDGELKVSPRAASIDTKRSTGSTNLLSRLRSPDPSTPSPATHEISAAAGECISEGEKIWRMHLIEEEEQREEEERMCTPSLQMREQDKVPCSYTSTYVSPVVLDLEEGELDNSPSAVSIGSSDKVDSRNTLESITLGLQDLTVEEAQETSVDSLAAGVERMHMKADECRKELHMEEVGIAQVRGYLTLTEYLAAVEEKKIPLYGGKAYKNAEAAYAAGKAFNPVSKKWIKVELQQKRDKEVNLELEVELLRRQRSELQGKRESEKDELLKKQQLEVVAKIKENEALKCHMEKLAIELAAQKQSFAVKVPTAPVLVVLDTNCFFHHWRQVKDLVDEMFDLRPDASLLLPREVLEELDSKKSNTNPISRDSTCTFGERVRDVRRFLVNLEDEVRNAAFGVVRRQTDEEYYKDEGYNQFPQDLRHDDAILNCCLFFQRRCGRTVILVTEDKMFHDKARINGFTVHSMRDMHLGHVRE